MHSTVLNFPICRPRLLFPVSAGIAPSVWRLAFLESEQRCFPRRTLRDVWFSRDTVTAAMRVDFEICDRSLACVEENPAWQPDSERRDVVKGDAFSYPPRGLRREDAARYVGVGLTKFDQMVADSRMPKPKKVDGRVVWDRIKLDAAFTDLPGDDEENIVDFLRQRKHRGQ